MYVCVINHYYTSTWKQNLNFSSTKFKKKTKKIFDLFEKVEFIAHKFDLRAINDATLIIYGKNFNIAQVHIIHLSRVIRARAAPFWYRKINSQYKIYTTALFRLIIQKIDLSRNSD